MPLSILILIIFSLSLIGIISLTDALVRFALHKKSTPGSITLLICDFPCNTEHIIKKTVKKYPSSEITADTSYSSEETKKMLEILQRKYSNILIN